MSNPNGKQRLLPVALVAIIALLGVAGFLGYRLNELNKVNTVQAEKLDETNLLKADLEKQYYESLAELEEMRGTNEEMNALIDEQKAELTKQKGDIDRLLVDKRNLSQARKEIAALKEQANTYLAELVSLREENELLAQENQTLLHDRDSLSTSLVETSMRNEELSEARASLVSEKAVLEEERAVLSNRVNFASVVKVGNVDVTGLRAKESGKTVKKRYAKNVDLLNICFETTINEVATPGSEEFYVRVINPLGETLAIEEMGSGVLENALTKEQVRYTKMIEHQYQNDAGEICLTWDTPISLPKGDYGVEVYNKGYLAGTGEFRLK